MTQRDPRRTWNRVMLIAIVLAAGNLILFFLSNFAHASCVGDCDTERDDCYRLTSTTKEAEAWDAARDKCIARCNKKANKKMDTIPLDTDCSGGNIDGKCKKMPKSPAPPPPAPAPPKPQVMR